MSKVEQFLQNNVDPLVNRGKAAIEDGFRGTGRAIDWTRDQIGAAYQASAKKLYELGRFTHLHTSYQPVYFEDPLHKGLTAWAKEQVHISQGNPAQTSVSLPFRLQGENIRAARNHLVQELWDGDYPMLLLVFQDPNPRIIGDEVLSLEAMGSVGDILHKAGARIPTWRLWMPATFEIEVNTGQIKKKVTKDQASLHAGDVVQLFVNEINASVPPNTLTVYDRDMHQAIAMLTRRSDSLQKRWELLDERLKWDRHLVKNYEAIAGLLWPMLEINTSQQFSDLVSQLADGQIKTIGDWNKSFANLPDLKMESTAAVLPRVLFNAVNIIPGPANQEKLIKVPARIFFGLAGLSYFNALMDGYEREVIPQLRRLGTSTAKAMGESVGALGDIKDAQVEAWQAARRKIEKEKPQLVAAFVAEAQHLIKDSASQTRDALRGAPPKTLIGR